MKKQIIFLLMAMVMPLCAMAQADSTQVKKKERRVELYGHVYDSFTKAPLKAHLTLMRAQDSTVVDTMTCWQWRTESAYYFKVPARQADYIIKGTCEGYEDGYLDYQLRHIARNNYFELPRLLLKKKMAQDDIWREDSLGGVVVRGTKVKIAYRGDTIVYNASAFNLPEGSMLDGLIRQLPGAELKDNGDIYVNGKKIDYLMLNGKDFFKGQNKVMLENLPYFTVKDIKVYNKQTERSQLLGHDVEARDYVMDVGLKREYNRGYMANAEAGAGTGERYMARLFGLYYDDHTRLSLFGNVNNVNETRKPGGDGEWRPSNMPQGLRTTRQTGLDLSTEDQDKRWEENMSASVEWSDADNQTRTATETFATGGNIMRGAWSQSVQKDFRLQAYNQFSIQKPFMLYTNLSLTYTNGHRDTQSQDSTYRAALINHTQNDGLNQYRTLQLRGNASWYKKFDWGDYMSLDYTISYDRQRPSEQFSRQQTYYAQDDTHEERHYYTDSHQSGYQYHLEPGYTLQLLNNWHISPRLGYWQTQRSTTQGNYRLDWLQQDSPLGWLPSSEAMLLQVIDRENSSEVSSMTHGYSAGLRISHSDDNGFFSVDLPIDNNDERMHYRKGALDTIARRNYTQFSPSLNMYRWGIKRGLQHVYYNMQTTQPRFTSLMPNTTSTNPLAVWTDNPGLKANTTHRLSLRFCFNNDSTKHFLNLWTNANLTHNAWGTRTSYNQTTGGYSYTNDNIGWGNWYWGMGISYQQPIDRQKRLTLTQRNDVEFTHSRDFDILYVTAAPSPDASQQHPLSTVKNLTLGETLKLEYQHDKLTASMSGHLDYRRATGDRQNFERISAFDYDYGCAVQYTVPWLDISLSTDLRMFSRRGYYSAMMNDDHLVWNAQLSRSFLKERLTAKLQAFDLLHQLSNTQYSVNAQGRTETWNNALPRYVLLSVAYKFTRKP